MSGVLQLTNLLAVGVVTVAAAVWAYADAVVRRSALYRSGAAHARALGPSALRILERVDTVVFDPVGTLTAGELRVVAVEPLDPAHDRNLRWFAGALQHNADDPIAKAISRLAGRGRVTDFQHVPGVGTAGSVDRHPVRVGRLEWIGVDAPEDGWGSTVAVEVDGRAMGRITVADTIRPEAAPTTAAMTESGLRVIVLAQTSATAAHLQAAVGTADVRVADDHCDLRADIGETATIAVVARQSSAVTVLQTRDVTVSDGAPALDGHPRATVEMSDVAIHHVASTLTLLRGAAPRVRLVRRAVAGITAIAVASLLVAPSTALDAVVTLATGIALALAVWIPLARWE